MLLRKGCEKGLCSAEAQNSKANRYLAGGQGSGSQT